LILEDIIEFVGRANVGLDIKLETPRRPVEDSVGCSEGSDGFEICGSGFEGSAIGKRLFIKDNIAGGATEGAPGNETDGFVLESIVGATVVKARTGGELELDICSGRLEGRPVRGKLCCSERRRVAFRGDTCGRDVDSVGTRPLTVESMAGRGVKVSGLFRDC